MKRLKVISTSSIITMNVSKINKRIIRKVGKLKTNPIPMFDVKNKLELFAVKTGLKPAFQGCRRVECESGNELSLLRQIAVMMKLKHKTTANPPLYFSRNPTVRSSFLKAYYNQRDFEALWVYNSSVVETEINDCILGKLNEGHIFGYPECCIRWHEETRVLEVESSFEDLEKHMSRNPLLIQQLQIETEEEMYKSILNMPYPTKENDKVWEVINEHILGTYEKYPFVPHWACLDCLKGKNRETEELNEKYKELALAIDFHEEFLSKVNEALHYLKEAPI